MQCLVNRNGEYRVIPLGHYQVLTMKSPCLFLNSEAIIFLTASILKDPSNIEAYKERIHAHFEMGNIELAIEDYNKLKELELHKKALLTDQFNCLYKGK